MKYVLIVGYIEQLLQETIEQCNAGRGDLSDEEHAAKATLFCLLVTRQSKCNATAQKLISVASTT